MANPTLHHVPGDACPWQWRRLNTWPDDITHKPTSYLAGFMSRENAVRYGLRQGWEVPEQTGTEE